MAKPNYAFAKRQRDLARKQKKEEKRLRKAVAPEKSATDTAPVSPGDQHPDLQDVPSPDAGQSDPLITSDDTDRNRPEGNPGP